VFWNAAMIAALVFYGHRSSQGNLAIALAWGTVLGSALQFGIQVPFVFKYAPRIRPSLQTSLEPVREVIRSFGPVVVGRGVVQLSGYIDQVIASYLQAATVSALAYAQTIYFLPISLFGMSVAAAELPQMSGTVGTSEEITKLHKDRKALITDHLSALVLESAGVHTDLAAANELDRSRRCRALSRLDLLPERSPKLVQQRRQRLVLLLPLLPSSWPPPDHCHD